MLAEPLMIILNAGAIILAIGIVCFVLICIALFLFKLIFVIADKLFGDCDKERSCLPSKRL